MGGFFPKLDEKYGDRDREYNWWGCSYRFRGLAYDWGCSEGSLKRKEEGALLRGKGNGSVAKRRTTLWWGWRGRVGRRECKHAHPQPHSNSNPGQQLTLRGAMANSSTSWTVLLTIAAAAATIAVSAFSGPFSASCLLGFRLPFLVWFPLRGDVTIWWKMWLDREAGLGSFDSFPSCLLYGFVSKFMFVWVG